MRPRRQAPEVRARRMKVNLPLLAVVTLATGLGQVAELAPFRAWTTADLGVGLLAAGLNTAAWTTACAATAALLDRLGRRALTVSFWSLALFLSTLVFWDGFSYRWLALHLDDSLPMLYWNIAADFQGMRAKVLALALVLGAYAVGGPLVVAACRALSGRLPGGDRALTWRQWSALLLVAMTLGGLEPVVAARWSSAPGYRRRHEVIWLAHLREAAPPAQAGAWVIHHPVFNPLPTEKQVREVLATVHPGDGRANLSVYLFVIDSLRADAITPAIAPHLAAFRLQCRAAARSVASANCTHISWTAIVHAVNPLYWSAVVHQPRATGAVPLRLLRRAGFHLHALAAPRLNYFGFARSAFGEDLALADDIVDQASLGGLAAGLNAGDLDRRVMERLDARLRHAQGADREVYLCFLDAPHHDYEWPADYPARFTPWMARVPLRADAIDARNVELLRNRYQNAVAFDDALFGDFLQTLRQRGLLDSSLIVVTGDHGEEFLEAGHLVHSSALNRFQLEVPILFYAPPRLLARPEFQHQAPLASHLDIFPTLFDLLGLAQPAGRLLRGRSVVSATPPTFAFCAQCSSFTPTRLLVDGGRAKLVLNLDGARKLGHTPFARRLEVEAVLDEDYRPAAFPPPGAPATPLPSTPPFRAALETLLPPASF